MASGFVQLWAVPTHTISLTATRPGSVIATFYIQGATSQEVLNRFTQLSTLLADPNSAESIQARNSGIPVIRSTTVTPAAESPPIGLIVAAAIGGVLILIGIIILSIIAARKCRDRQANERYTPLMSMGTSGSHDIGTPYAFTHDHGESSAAKNLVSREEAQQAQMARAAAGGSLRGPSPNSAARPSVVPGVKHFKLIADIRDVGQGVLTGAKLGSLVEVQDRDYTETDWIWGTIGGKSGWVPRNHLSPAN